MVQLIITITTHLLKPTISHSYPEPTTQEWNCRNKRKFHLFMQNVIFFKYLNIVFGLKQKTKNSIKLTFLN